MNLLPKICLCFLLVSCSSEVIISSDASNKDDVNQVTDTSSDIRSDVRTVDMATDTKRNDATADTNKDDSGNRTTITLNQLKAFPTALGVAKDVSTFRDGEIRKVTSLANSGPGTLRAALERAGAAIIIFEVDGVIELSSVITVTNDKYIAGQSAFVNGGRGITIKRDGTYPDPIVGGAFGNVVWRFIRFRGGAGPAGETNGDNYQPYRGSGLHMIDHCSFSWSTDENVSFADNDGYTIQYSISSEGLLWASHEYSTDPTSNAYPNPHSKGSLTSGTPKMSWIGNIFANNHDRNPLVQANGTGDTEIEFINNYFYNRGIFGIQLNTTQSGQGTFKVDAVNNFWQDGPNSNTNRWGFIWPDEPVYNNKTNVNYNAHRIHLAGNEGPRRTAGSDEWDILGSWDDNRNAAAASKAIHYVLTPLLNYTEPSEIIPTADIKEDIIPHAGAYIYRDAADLRVISTIENNNGNFVNADGDSRGDYPQFTAYTGGWDSLETSKMTAAPIDLDADGIPDDWASAFTIENPAGYTAIELYLAEIAGDFERLN